LRREHGSKQNRKTGKKYIKYIFVRFEQWRRCDRTKQLSAQINFHHQVLDVSEQADNIVATKHCDTMKSFQTQILQDFKQ